MRKSSELYRLERTDEDGYTTIIEFHTVVNGNTYVSIKEYLNGIHRSTSKPKFWNDKERGNNFYKKCLEEGYKFVGRFEMDVCGSYTKI